MHDVQRVCSTLLGSATPFTIKIQRLELYQLLEFMTSEAVLLAQLRNRQASEKADVVDAGWVRWTLELVIQQVLLTVSSLWNIRAWTLE